MVIFIPGKDGLYIEMGPRDDVAICQRVNTQSRKLLDYVPTILKKCMKQHFTIVIYSTEDVVVIFPIDEIRWGHSDGEHSSVHTDVCLYVCLSKRFPGIVGGIHERNGLKLGMLMYPDHLQKWLDFVHDMLIVLLLAQFWLNKMGQIWGC